MYQLQTENKESNLLKKYKDQSDQPSQKSEKIGKNLYLKKSHFDFLDSRAEERDVSRNKALRDILDQVMGDMNE